MRESGFKLEPEFIMIDFEIGAINATCAEFENLSVMRCLFNFISHYGEKYGNWVSFQYRDHIETTLRICITCFFALTFLHENDVIDLFKAIFNR